MDAAGSPSLTADRRAQLAGNLPRQPKWRSAFPICNLRSTPRVITRRLPEDIALAVFGPLRASTLTIRYGQPIPGGDATPKATAGHAVGFLKTVTGDPPFLLTLPDPPNSAARRSIPEQVTAEPQAIDPQMLCSGRTPTVRCGKARSCEFPRRYRKDIYKTYLRYLFSRCAAATLWSDGQDRGLPPPNCPCHSGSRQYRRDICSILWG